MIENINYFIPSIFEIYTLFFSFFIFFTFYIIGQSLTKQNDIIINFSLGWSIYILYFLLFSIILKFSFNFIAIIYYILVLFLISIYLKKVKFNLKFFFSLIFIIPLILILISTKTFGYDSFAYILDRLVFLIENKRFPVSSDGVFRSNYTFTSLLVYHIINFPLNFLIENIPAIFDFVLLFISSICFYKIFKINNFLSKFYLPLSFLIIFFNPLIMNVYSYSSYEDLHVSFVIFCIYYFIYFKGFKLENFDLKNGIVLGFLISLLMVSKTSGPIHGFGVLFSIVVLNFYALKKNFKLFLIICTLSLSSFILWQYHIFISEINFGINYKGFRLDVLKNFPSNYYLQFLEKKLLLFANLFFLIIPFLIIPFKNIFKTSHKLIFFNFFPLLFWNVFLIFFQTTLQTYGHAINLHNYFRFISHYSHVFTFLGLLMIIDLKIYFFKELKLESKKIYSILSILFMLMTYFNFDKIRRDINPIQIQLIKSIKESYKEKTNQETHEILKGENQKNFHIQRFYYKKIFEENFVRKNIFKYY